MQAIVITPTNCGVHTPTMSPNEKDVKVLIRFFGVFGEGYPAKASAGQ